MQTSTISQNTSSAFGILPRWTMKYTPFNCQMQGHGCWLYAVGVNFQFHHWGIKRCSVQKTDCHVPIRIGTRNDLNRVSLTKN